LEFGSQIDIRHLSSGVYYLKFKTKAKRIIKKIIVD
jgi:hypothetical protein